MRQLHIMTVALLTLSMAGLVQLGAGAASDPASVAQTAGTPVSIQLAWALQTVNQGAGRLSAVDLSTRFTPELLTILPAEQLTDQFAQLARLGPVTHLGFTRPPTATQAIALLNGQSGVPVVLAISVEAQAPYRITGLGLAPVPPPPSVTLQPAADDVAGSGAVAGRFDIGGRQLYLACRGLGSPTVVLESGLGDSAAPWFAVESAVAGFTRVCSYDRANTIAGASDSAPTPRTGQDAVSDLHALLQAAGVPGPYVLVGHSIGGHFARLYAAAYPAAVAGLALIDPSHEDVERRGRPLFGLPPEPSASEPPSQSVGAEGIDRDLTASQVRAARAAAPLRPMPLVVVTAGRLFEQAQLPPGVSATALNHLWRELGADLAALVPGGRQVIAEQSGHYIHQSEPGLVVGAVRAVVEAVRRPLTATADEMTATSTTPALRSGER